VSTEAKPAAELSALNRLGIGVRVYFFWQDDRYCHRIEAVDGHQMRALLESLEGDQNSDWPASPPLQHVNVSWITSDSEQVHVAMLVGAAGRSHWSMCVSARDRQCQPREGDPGDIELSFDVACRTRSSANWLGSTYRVLAPPIAISDRVNCAFVPADGPGCVVISQAGQLELDAADTPMPLLRCAARVNDVVEPSMTVRWRYVVRLSTGGPLCVGKRPRE
jgi:hypothetical protein